jgi:phosphoserine phosphatase RsbU/P
MMPDKKILIADDSESYLRIIQQIFEIVGQKYELFFARDGKEACDLAIKHLPDLIILDVIMPEMNGIEVTKILRKNEDTKQTPIIMLSATESLKAAYEVGANDFISKPFNQYELLIKVRSALNLVDQINENLKHKKNCEEKQIEISKLQEAAESVCFDKVQQLNYSRRIQNSILPTQEVINKTLGDHFILTMPKSIVSGDFYWIGKHGDKSVVAAIDCTGHGINGALMTMAGMAFLNEILGRNEKYTPARVLNELRKMVMNLLKYTGEEGESNDGMDVSITMLDASKNTLLFAGANNPIYLIQDGQLNAIKGDRMPIGINLNFERAFEDVEIPVKKGDSVYLFTDGFADQFGGNGNKKFRYKQFQETILELYKKPMEKQKEALSEIFINWKGNYPQVDDVLIIGYKI